MFPNYRTTLIIVAVFSLMAGGPFRAAAANDGEPTSSAPQLPTVTVADAQRYEIASTVLVTGTLIPRETVVVGADVDGLRIVELLVDVGDTVERGALLARLATDMLETEIAQNAAQISGSEASLAQAQTQVADAESIASEAQSSLARAKALAAKGIVGRDILDQRISAATSATARLSSARHGIAVAQADRSLQEAQRQQLELRRSKAEITAPTDGLVLSRGARLGAIVSTSGDSLFEVARDGLIELDAKVTETIIPSLKKGQAVTVTLPGGGDALAGSVRLVSPQVDPATRLGTVKVALPRSDALRSGSFAQGVVEIARSRGVIVPRTAVFVDGDKTTVQVVQDGVVDTRPVTLGVATGRSVEILSGVKALEQVVVFAGTFLRNGDQVTPLTLALQTEANR